MMMFAVAACFSLVSVAWEDTLFMDQEDAIDVWGKVQPVGSTVAVDPDLRPPPGLRYDLGVLVIGVLPSSEPRVWEVYVENATGWEPLQPASEGGGDIKRRASAPTRPILEWSDTPEIYHH